jgi:hypothetical protein
MALPYIIPDDELDLNLGILLLIIASIGETARKRLVINNEIAHIFFFLVKNPALLNKFLYELEKPGLPLLPTEAFSVASLSTDDAVYYDRKSMRFLLSSLTQRKLIEIVYLPQKGFYYKASELGVETTSKLDSAYFQREKDFIDHLEKVQSISLNNMINVLNRILKSELA